MLTYAPRAAGEQEGAYASDDVTPDDWEDGDNDQDGQPFFGATVK